VAFPNPVSDRIPLLVHYQKAKLHFIPCENRPRRRDPERLSGCYFVNHPCFRLFGNFYQNRIQANKTVADMEQEHPVLI